jgi:hypothetical protein
LMATVDKPSLFSFTVDHWITEGYCRRLHSQSKRLHS